MTKLDNPSLRNTSDEDFDEVKSKNVDFIVFDMDHEDFKKIDSKKCGLQKLLIWMISSDESEPSWLEP